MTRTSSWRLPTLLLALAAVAAHGQPLAAQGTNTVEVSADVVAPTTTAVVTSMSASNLTTGSTTTIAPNDANSAVIEITGIGQSAMSVQFALPTTLTASTTDSLAITGWSGEVAGDGTAGSLRRFDPLGALSVSFEGESGSTGRKMRISLGTAFAAALRQQRGRYVAVALLTAYFTEI